MNRTRSIPTLAAAAIAFTSVPLSAGPVNPPAGPVGATMKTLAEVEPRTAISAAATPGDADSLFRITAPGSYYLTGNIQGASGKHGIEIAVGGVTLDLAGFAVLGAAGTLDGVTVTGAGRNDIAVINGSVRGWGDDGIDLQNALGVRVADIRASANVHFGIHTGDHAVITGCATRLNGYSGISAALAAAVSGCSSNQETLGGIVVDSASTVTDCAVYDSGGLGISIGNACTLKNCAVYSSASTGVYAADGAVITGCTIGSNGGAGMIVSQGCTIAECSVNVNALDGIQVNSDCQVRGNICWLNGYTGDGANIHATSSNNRIDGNTCTGADRGIDADAAGCFIVRNSCSNNTANYSVVAGSVCYVVQATNSGAVNGSAGGISPGSTDPNANFSY